MLSARIRCRIRFQHATIPGMTACWIWAGDNDYDAALEVWGKLRGPIPEGMNLRVFCPNRACVNPNHRKLADA